MSTEAGAVLVFDEVSAGFRLNTGGSHLLYGVTPDVAVFAKAIGNGYPMAAIIGTRDVMEAAQSTFISSTNWTERIGPAAALATITKHRDQEVAGHLVRVGKLVQSGWKAAADRVGLDIEVGGIPPLAHFTIECPDSQAAHTLFNQTMLEKGFLASKGFYATFAHRDEHVDSYLEAVDVTFASVAHALDSGRLNDTLKGPVAHTGFRRLT